MWSPSHPLLKISRNPGSPSSSSHWRIQQQIIPVPVFITALSSEDGSGVVNMQKLGPRYFMGFYVLKSLFLTRLRVVELSISPSEYTKRAICIAGCFGDFMDSSFAFKQMAGDP